jgi:hypothetical protein
MWGVENETLRVNQIAARILLGQAFDLAPHRRQPSNRCDAAEITVWKFFEDIKCRIYI